MALSGEVLSANSSVLKVKKRKDNVKCKRKCQGIFVPGHLSYREYSTLGKSKILKYSLYHKMCNPICLERKICFFRYSIKSRSKKIKSQSMPTARIEPGFPRLNFYNVSVRLHYIKVPKKKRMEPVQWLQCGRCQIVMGPL